MKNKKQILIVLIPILLVVLFQIWFVYEERKLDEFAPANEKNLEASEEEIITTTAENNIVNAPPTSDSFIATFDKAVEELDPDYFVTDFENYEVKDEIKKFKEGEISQIAQIGFEESAKRIAGEGAENKDSETIEIEEIIPNNYFTRKYRESDEVYKDLKMTAYVVTRENDIGNGIKIYIDMATGLIVGGEAFGD